jgi:hypothetical protein
VKVALGILLVALAAAGFLARDRFESVFYEAGAPAAQRPLAGGTAGANPPVAAPVRVVLIDGLHRADAPGLASLEALCAGGLDLVVDVGFPTKSLPVQQTLWSGLTNQQLGARGDNLEVAPVPTSVPRLVAGSVAVVESFTRIARSVGFATVLPGPMADRVAPEADPEQVQAWREGGFAAAAAAEVAGAAPLVLVHVLQVDYTSHRYGRGSAEQRAALGNADRILGELVAAAPAAQWLVLADHGHVRDGGHGDAEEEVRTVRACWSPAPPGLGAAPRGAEIHLVDVGRWLADALGAPRHAQAQGRTLAVAAAHPDRGATLPRPGALRSLLALVLLAAGAALGLVASRGRVTALWPIGAALAIALLHGLPTLSHRAPPYLVAVTGASFACIAIVVERRVANPSPARLVFTSLGLVLGIVAALIVVTGLPHALAGGPAPRVPGWTGLLGASAPLLAGALAATGSVLALEGLLGRLRE